MAPAVHLAVAPPDGFAEWSEEEWRAWLAAHPWEPADRLADRGDWLVFLYMIRVHARRSRDGLAPFLERLMREEPIRSADVARLQSAFAAVRAELDTIPAGRLWTGTQFYTADDLHALILRNEGETGKRGQDLAVGDLWRDQFATLDRVLAAAHAQGRGVYFGYV